MCIQVLNRYVGQWDLMQSIVENLKAIYGVKSSGIYFLEGSGGQVAFVTPGL